MLPILADFWTNSLTFGNGLALAYGNPVKVWKFDTSLGRNTILAIMIPQILISVLLPNKWLLHFFQAKVMFLETVFGKNLTILAKPWPM